LFIIFADSSAVAMP